MWSLFDTSLRRSRLDYFFVHVYFAFGFAATAFLLHVAEYSDNRVMIGLSAAVVVGFLLVAIVASATVTIQRLNDIGWSPWWTIAYYILPLAWLVIWVTHGKEDPAYVVASRRHAMSIILCTVIGIPLALVAVGYFS